MFAVYTPYKQQLYTIVYRVYTPDNRSFWQNCHANQVPTRSTAQQSAKHTTVFNSHNAVINDTNIRNGDKYNDISRLAFAFLFTDTIYYL